MKKIMSLFTIIAMCFAMLFVTKNISIAAGEPQEGFHFAFYSEQPYVCDLTQTFLADPVFYYKADAESQPQQIQNSELTIVMSDPNVAEFDVTRNSIKLKQYGTFTMQAKYVLNGETLTSEEQLFIVCPFLYENEFGALDKYEVELNNSKKIDTVSLDIVPFAGTQPTYPDGVTKEEYYDVTWESSDPTVATVEVVEDNDVFSKVKVTGVKSGSTYVICTITTEEDVDPTTGNQGQGASANAKRVRIPVSVDLTEEDPEENNNNNENNTNENKESSEKTENKTSAEETKTDNTVAKKKLSQTGEKLSLIVAIGVFVLAAFVARIKFKNKK